VWLLALGVVKKRQVDKARGRCGDRAISGTPA
jgi:hypothetical protein